MPYALFCNDAKLSKAYPTEADVWKLARKSGLVVDAVSEEEKPAPRPVLDNDYEIRPCQPDPHEDPARNKADAEREALTGVPAAFVSVVEDPALAGHRRRGSEPALRRRRRQRSLFRRQRHAGLAPVQSPDRAGDLEHLARPDRTRPARRRFHRAPGSAVRISGRSGQSTAAQTAEKISPNAKARMFVVHQPAEA